MASGKGISPVNERSIARNMLQARLDSMRPDRYTVEAVDYGNDCPLYGYLIVLDQKTGEKVTGLPAFFVGSIAPSDGRRMAESIVAVLDRAAGYLTTELREWLEPGFYPEMPGFTEGNVDEAFVDGIIAFANGVAPQETWEKGEAYQIGYRFACRWGERGKDLGHSLIGLRRESQEGERAPKTDPGS
jgi:hypothetical protein